MFLQFRAACERITVLCYHGTRRNRVGGHISLTARESTTKVTFQNTLNGELYGRTAQQRSRCA